MKFLVLFSLAITFVTGECSSQLVYMCKSGEVTFFSEAPLENIEAHNFSPNSFLNTSTREIAFLIPISNFKFRKELMREHFNEKYMESDKFPMATFNGKINEPLDFSVAGVYPVTVNGKLTIHGIVHEVIESGTFTVNEKNIDLKSEMRIATADYHISIPHLLFQNIADTIRVNIKTTYVPYQKKP